MNVWTCSVLSPEYEAAIDVPGSEERARLVANAVHALLTAPPPAPQ